MNASRRHFLIDTGALVATAALPSIVWSAVGASVARTADFVIDNGGPPTNPDEIAWLEYKHNVLNRLPCDQVVVFDRDGRTGEDGKPATAVRLVPKEGGP